MSLASIVGSDFVDVVDGLESVTIAGFDPGFGADVSNTLLGLVRPIKLSEGVESNGYYTADDAVIHWTGAPLLPYLGWTVSTALSEYTIIGSSIETGVTRVRVVGRALLISLLASEIINIDRATFTKDATGSPKETWHRYGSGITAHLKLDGGTSETDKQRTREKRTGTIYIPAADVAALSIFNSNHAPDGFDSRLRISFEGQYYRVTGWSRYKELSKYFEAKVEHVPWWPEQD